MTSAKGLKKYKLTCKLPGFKNNIGNFEKPEKAKEKAQEILDRWLDGASLVYNPNEEENE